jgi:hypothetical protein
MRRSASANPPSITRYSALKEFSVEKTVISGLMPWTCHTFRLYTVSNSSKGGGMAEKSKSLLSIGAALASLSGLSVQGAEAKIS